MSAASGNIFTFQGGAGLRAVAPGEPSPIAATGVVVDIEVNIGLLGVAVQVHGNYVGTMAIEVSFDQRVSWVQIDAIVSQQITKVYPFLQTAPFIVTDMRVRGAMWASGIAEVQIIPWNPPSVPTIVASGNQQQLVHAPDKFRVVAANAAGATALWIPAVGRKFRLLRVSIQPTPDVSISSAPGNGISTVVDLLDGGVSLNVNAAFWVPKNIPASPQTNVPLVMDLGPIGYLSQATGNVLNVNLPQALTTGFMRVEAMGTEE